MAKAASGHVTEPGEVAEVEPVVASVQREARVDPREVPLADRVQRIFEIEQVARERDERIVNTTASYSDASVVETCDPDGNHIWTIETESSISGEDGLIIYRAGNILLADRNGIYLIDEDGATLWVIDMDELDAIEGGTGGLWKLNPMEDGGIVASGWDPRVEEHEYAIFYFEPAE